MTTTTILPWPLVRRGDQAHPVPSLQYLLRARGHSVAVDGIFGPKTDAAVRAFQQSRNLAVDGIVGPKTWTALIIQVRQGSQGDAVRAVQENSSSAPVSPAKASKSTGSSGPTPTLPFAASSRRSRSPWTESWARSPGGRWSAGCLPARK